MKISGSRGLWLGFGSMLSSAFILGILVLSLNMNRKNMTSSFLFIPFLKKNGQCYNLFSCHFSLFLVFN